MWQYYALQFSSAETLTIMRRKAAPPFASRLSLRLFATAMHASDEGKSSFHGANPSCYR